MGGAYLADGPKGRRSRWSKDWASELHQQVIVLSLGRLLGKFVFFIVLSLGRLLGKFVFFIVKL